MSVLGYAPIVNLSTIDNQSQPACPGQLYRHYSPKAKLTLLNKPACEIKGVIVGFNDRVYSKESRLFSLGITQDPVLAARKLYAALRQLDIEDVKEAFVDMNFPHEGLWQTIRERLEKSGKSGIDVPT